MTSPQNIRSVCTLFRGSQLALEIRDRVRVGVEAREHNVRPPKLVAIAVGNEPASQIYLARKQEAATYCGITFDQVRLSEEVREAELVDVIQQVNKDNSVDGLIVQLPLPPHLNEVRVCNSVSPDKDVDGFTQTNLGRLMQNVEEASLVPCTALAVRKITESVLGPGYFGRSAVVIGRSHNVGLPIQVILGADRAKGGLDLTTSLCHRHTPRPLLARLVRGADLVVSAAGVPGIVDRAMVRPGAVLVDVGLNRIVEQGRHVVTGDFCRSVREVASVVTPVPGGVGPCTVACLMENTLVAARNRCE